MYFVEFKLPDEIGVLLSTDHYISYIMSGENGFRIAFCNNKEDFYYIVFDFGYAVVDYRVSQEGRRFDHHMGKFPEFYLGKKPEHWLLIEVKDSEYLKKINEESSGLYLMLNPELKHYMTGDVESSVDIISIDEPKVYKIERDCKKCI